MRVTTPVFMFVRMLGCMLTMIVTFHRFILLRRKMLR